MDMNERVIPVGAEDLLQAALVGHLATRRSDGNLQSNPVWFDWDGTHINVSQTRTRQKMRNVEHDPHVALSIVDPQNPYRYLEVRGVVDRIDSDPDLEFINHLAQRYLGEERYPWHQPGDERVVIRITPVRASTMG